MKDALVQVANLMTVSARTAPKSGGKDYVNVTVLDGTRVSELGNAMIAYGQERNNSGFVRDGQNVLDSLAVVLVGIKEAAAMHLDCGACGLDFCSELEPVEKREFRGPQCMFRLLDLGIALGSAVKTASLLNVDNRIMYRIGVVARRMAMSEDDVVMGIPLSAAGKSIYFDRKG
ncbi:MAG TPA: DUF2148 domain-containing protein [Atribacteraceae bacterium]|nr:DUF2148 domain-containing protein [Atribacteraceae bacterium]